MKIVIIFGDMTHNFEFMKIDFFTCMQTFLSSHEKSFPVDVACF